MKSIRGSVAMALLIVVLQFVQFGGKAFASFSEVCPAHPTTNTTRAM